MFRLSRREILEQLVRLGVKGLSRLKADCRSFERYWESNMPDMNAEEA